MSIDKAIETYVDFTSKVFSARQIGRDGKFSTTAFEDTIRSIIKDATGNSDERILDGRSHACKV